MAYIGRTTDKISNIEVLDNITFDGSSSYTLQKGGSNFTPSSANTLLLSIDGVVQAGNFTVSGSTIDFGTAVAGTSTCDFILHYGVGLITAPSDGTVTTAKLADSSVSLAKLTATGTKDATTFLRGDNTFAAAGLNGWSEDGANNNLLPASASAGIYLGVNSATASNLLDDYEEGTFTPTIIGSTVAGTASYSLQVGRYTKIGNIVFINIILSYSAGNGAGNLRISNLPFTALTAASDQSLAMSVSNIALTAGHVATNYVLSNSSLVIITSYPSGGGAGANVTYDGAGVINVTGHYET
jgi:hypothetical protein